MVLLNYHKSIACLPHQPDFVIIHHVIDTVVTFSNKVIHHRIANGCWPSGAAIVLGKDDQANAIATVQAVFMFSRFPISFWSSFFCPVFRFTPVRNAVFFF